MFISKLNKLSNKTYRLPSQAEWEYAARAENKYEGYKYAGSNDIDEVAEYDGNNDKSSKIIGGKKSNELGIYNMSGNVREWCSDWSDENFYNKSISKNPQGALSGSMRIRWGELERQCFQLPSCL